MIPFLGLGIPTGPPAAVMMIALLIHGSARVRCSSPSSPVVLGVDRQHVHRQYDSGHFEPPLGGDLREPAPGSIPDSISDHPPDLSGGNLFGKLEYLRAGGPAGFGVVGYVFRELKFDLPPFILA